MLKNEQLALIAVLAGAGAAGLATSTAANEGGEVIIVRLGSIPEQSLNVRSHFNRDIGALLQVCDGNWCNGENGSSQIRRDAA